MIRKQHVVLRRPIGVSSGSYYVVETVRGKERTYCHTFFELEDGSALAFFQFLDPDDQAEMKLDSRSSLNHVALSSTLVDQERL